MQRSPIPAARSADLVRIETRSELIAASGDDVFVRCSVPFDIELDAWALGTGVAWFNPHRRRHGVGWLTVVAEPEVVPLLVAGAIDARGGGLSGVTVPAKALSHLDEDHRPAEYNLWDWFSTDELPPVQPGEDTVAWAEPTDTAAIENLIDTDSPRHSARPGDADVQRWCVIRGADEHMLACAALVEHLPGVPHLASIVTRADQRGRGLGRAVTAWITRQVLESGAPLVTLGMYADNDVARRMYLALGYRCAHEFASGYLPGRRGPGDVDPVHDEAD